MHRPATPGAIHWVLIVIVATLFWDNKDAALLQGDNSASLHWAEKDVVILRDNSNQVVLRGGNNTISFCQYIVVALVQDNGKAVLL